MKKYVFYIFAISRGNKGDYRGLIMGVAEFFFTGHHNSLPPLPPSVPPELLKITLKLPQKWGMEGGEGREGGEGGRPTD